MAYVGVDIGGTKIMVAAETSTGIRTTSYPTPTSPHELGRVLRDLFFALNVSVNGIGVGIPGIVQPDGTCWTPNTPAIDRVDLAKELQLEWAVPLFIDNDAKMALRAETAEPPRSYADPVLLVAVGTGIGGALKIDGSIVDGRHRTAGAFGWLRIKTTTGWQAWEQLASGRALDHQARQLGLAGGRDLVMRAKQGDGASMAAVDAWIEVLGMGIASLINIVDPELVLLSGGVTSHGEWFVQKLREVINTASSPLTADTPVELCHAGPEAVARGALWAISHHLTGGG